ncbi:MAG: nitroreductase family protein [Eubacteriales bacterium]|nr:nitroreductase family protein [Eubacteriales bacterium]
MQFSELAATRRSVRRYEERDVTDEQIHTLLEVARWAPSAGNMQPWHFYVVRDAALRAKICACQQHPAKWITYAPVIIVVGVEARITAAQYGDRGGDLYCLQDTAAAVQNILLCAHDSGLASCWVGAFREDACAQALGLTADIRPVAILPIGYAAQQPDKAPERRPVEEITTFL